MMSTTQSGCIPVWDMCLPANLKWLTFRMYDVDLGGGLVVREHSNTVPSFLLSRSPIAPDKRLRLCTHKHGTCSICWGTTDDFVGSANKSSLGESLSPILASYDHRSTGGPTAL